MKKRTKQVEKMVVIFNNYLKANKVIDMSDAAFSVFTHSLLELGIYKGFNYYYEKDYTDIMGNKSKIEVLCGTGDEEKLKEMGGYIQVY